MEGIRKLLEANGGSVIPRAVTPWILAGGTMYKRQDPITLTATASTNWPPPGLAAAYFGVPTITAPNQETLRELLGLDQGEEVVSYAVRLPDGTIDVRTIEP